MLETIALDGSGARRKSIKSGTPLEWSHDSQWVLMQDGSGACIVRATGGQYKCWRGFTAVSIAPDGSYALLLGNRDAKPEKKATKKKAAKKKAPDPSDPTNEPEQEGDDDSDATDDVAVAPPSGPLALYRAKLDGAFTDRPVLLVKVVEGAAVWVPSK